ncbi:MAG: Hsp70 family protein [Methanoregula sp.]|nr:Hsp70 family protein [Methanoregula sp.]
MQKDHPAETGRQRLGVDFGTGSTVAAMRDEKGVIHLCDIPGWSRSFPSGVREYKIPLIPSQILYTETGIRSIGAAVLTEGKNPALMARWLRHYILENSTVQVPAGSGRRTSYRNAGSNFLTALLTHAPNIRMGTAEVVFSVPVDAPDHYSAWLRAVATAAGFQVPFVIDEPCAAAAGYRVQISPGSLFLLIDFHADGLDITLVTPEEFSDESGGMYSRVLGKAHEDTGGSVIDGWIVQDVLNRNRLDETDPRVTRVLPLIRREAARAREALVMDTEAEIRVIDPVSGFPVTAQVSRSDLCRILEERGLFAAMNRGFDRALSHAGIRDGGEERIMAVLMVGECSAIPCVQDAVKQRWGTARVFCDHPVDAIARGAASANPETRESNRIRNDYAIRHWDPVAHEYRYRFIVRNGARYPSAGQVARFIISGAYDGQAYLGIPLCEIGTAGHDPHGHLELVSNDRGEVQIAGPAPDAIPARCPVFVNELEPTLLHASPPAQKGEPRFELRFFLDRQGYLCLTARDLLTGLIVKRDAQVFRLN